MAATFKARANGRLINMLDRFWRENIRDNESTFLEADLAMRPI